MKLESTVMKMVAEISKTPVENISLKHDLDKDLGVDSLDVVELTMDCEQKFQIVVPDWESERIKTVEDLIKVIVKHIEIQNKPEI